MKARREQQKLIERARESVTRKPTDQTALRFGAAWAPHASPLSRTKYLWPANRTWTTLLTFPAEQASVRISHQVEYVTFEFPLIGFAFMHNVGNQVVSSDWIGVSSIWIHNWHNNTHRGARWRSVPIEMKEGCLYTSNPTAIIETGTRTHTSIFHTGNQLTILQFEIFNRKCNDRWVLFQEEIILWESINVDNQVLREFPYRVAL